MIMADLGLGLSGSKNLRVSVNPSPFLSVNFYEAHLTGRAVRRGLWEAVASPLVEVVAFGLFPVSGCEGTAQLATFFMGERGGGAQ